MDLTDPVCMCSHTLDEHRYSRWHKQRRCTQCPCHTYRVDLDAMQKVIQDFNADMQANLALIHKPKPVMRVSSQQPSVEELAQHQGEWVATEGPDIVAAGTNFADVVEESRKSGRRCSIWRIPLPGDGRGWW